MVQAAALVLLSCASFAATSQALRLAVPRPAQSGLRAKLEAFERHKDEFDAVYVGSSTVARSFAPDVIDRRLSVPERPFRSFNLGIAGMGAYEAEYLLDEVLAMHPARLRVVVAEPLDYATTIDFRNAFTERLVRWHDASRTLRAIRAVLSQPELPRASRVLLHLNHMFRKYANFAMAPSIVAALRDDGSEAGGRDEGRVSRERMEATQGFLSLDEQAEPEVLVRRRLLLENPAEYRQLVARLEGALDADVAPPPSAAIAELVRRRDDLERAGVDLVYVVPPGIWDERVAPIRAANLVDDSLYFNDPRAYPELFELKNRFDMGHLNREGAVKFSRMFASALARVLGE